jgi:hypothetical protein
VKGGAILRQVRTPAIILVAYLILRAVFDGQASRGGLFSLTGSVSAGVAVLGGVVLVLRIVVLFVLPAVVVYRLVAHLADRGAKGG